MRQLASNPKLTESTSVLSLAAKLAKAAGISVESSMGLLLWLGSAIMTRHCRIRWPSGIWQPGGLTVSVVEHDDVAIDSVINAFIAMAKGLGVDPIHDTVKEGPAGLISRLEMQPRLMKKRDSPATITVDNLSALAELDTAEIESDDQGPQGNSRALIYPSGRAFLSYLYDTPFFNAIDEMIQHGNLSVRGKHDTHYLRQMHLNLFCGFFQGALVTLTQDTRVQGNMFALLRQMLIFWPTGGTRQNRRPGRIDIGLHEVTVKAHEGIESLAELSGDPIVVPDGYAFAANPLIDPGVGVRYTVLNREQRIARLAIGVAFWRIADGHGMTQLQNSDLAVADAILHLHEMGGRLMEHVVSKGKHGHEFARILLRLLDGESVQPGEETAFASETNLGANATGKLNELSILGTDGKLADEYRIVTGDTMRKHKKRWGL